MRSAAFAILILVACCMVAGCQTNPLLSKSLSSEEVGAPPTHFNRKIKTATGVDPMAREIERSLGYE